MTHSPVMNHPTTPRKHHVPDEPRAQWEYVIYGIELLILVLILSIRF